MQKYQYSGPVTEFGRCIDNRWTGQTMANSEGEAKRNLTYQYKKQHGKAPNSRVQLPEKVKMIF